MNVELVIDNMLGCLTVLEMAPSVLDHLWTQDRPICPPTSEYKMGPYIGQGRSNTKVCNKNKHHLFNDY